MEPSPDCKSPRTIGATLRLPNPRRTAATHHEEMEHTGGFSHQHLPPIPDSNDTAQDPTLPVPNSRDHLFSARRHQCHAASYKRYFDTKMDLEVESRGGTFRVYTAGSTGPIVMCLHGGGYTALTWALVAAQLKNHCRVVAFDQRGHGSTSTISDHDLSAETLAQDAAAIWDQLYRSESPATVLVGHSMGGAIAVHTAQLGSIPKLEGVVVVDVVEGTAIAALPVMMGILAQRPAEFTSLDVAFEWALANGVTRNPEAASVSLPSQLTAPTEESPNMRWVTPLKQSKPYWQGWYKGLSKAFLELQCPKVLLLAGTDRLDKELTIGQMQGKFQLALLPVAGHAIQEDEPAKTAETITAFLKRFHVGAANDVVLPRGAWGVAR